MTELEKHNKAVAKFNRFAAKTQQDPDYKAIKDFATNDFFKKQPEYRKRELAEAYARIELNRCNIEDLQEIMDYWKAARRAFIRANGKR